MTTKRWAAVGLALFLAGCGGSGNGDEGSTGTTTGKGVGAGPLRVLLTVNSGPGQGFARQNDTPGVDCGPAADQGIALATDGEVTVRDQANKIIGTTDLEAGKLAVVKTTSEGSYLGQTCIFEFNVDLKSGASFLIFDLEWIGESNTLNATADANEVEGGRLRLTKTL